MADVNASYRHQYSHITINEQSNVSLGDTHYHASRLTPAFFGVADYDRYKDINPERVAHTCQWFLKNKTFIHFRDTESANLLWVTADPGCGKSVLARALVDEWHSIASRDLTQREQLVIHCFFKDSGKQSSLTHGLCSLVHQLLCFDWVWTRCADELGRLHHRYGSGLLSNREVLWYDVFLYIISELGECQCICVLDALDEVCTDDQTYLLQKINNLHQVMRRPFVIREQRKSGITMRSNLKIIMTSRPYQSIEKEMRTLTCSFPQIRLAGEEESDCIQKEIDLVIEHNIDWLSHRLELSEDLKRRLHVKLREVEHRTYLWLKFVTIELDNMVETTEPQMSKQIDSLPLSVQEAYDQVLTKAHNRDRVLDILKMVLVAERPLHVSELDCLLEIKSSSTDVDQLDLQGGTNRGKSVRQMCGLFVQIVQGQIYLMHQTVKDFLLGSGCVDSALQWRGCIKESDAHACMAVRLLTWLNFDHFADARIDKGETNLGDLSTQCRIRHVIEIAFDKSHLGDDQSLLILGYLSLFSGESLTGYAVRTWYRHLDLVNLQERMCDIFLAQIVRLTRLRPTHLHLWTLMAFSAQLGTGYHVSAYHNARNLVATITEVLTPLYSNVTTVYSWKDTTNLKDCVRRDLYTSLLMSAIPRLHAFIYAIMATIAMSSTEWLVVRVMILAVLFRSPNSLPSELRDVLVADSDVQAFVHPKNGNLFCHTPFVNDFISFELLLSTGVALSGGLVCLDTNASRDIDEWGNLPPEAWLDDICSRDASIRSVQDVVQCLDEGYHEFVITYNVSFQCKYLLAIMLGCKSQIRKLGGKRANLEPAVLQRLLPDKAIHLVPAKLRREALAIAASAGSPEFYETCLSIIILESTSPVSSTEICPVCLSLSLPLSSDEWDTTRLHAFRSLLHLHRPLCLGPGALVERIPSSDIDWSSGEPEAVIRAYARFVNNVHEFMLRKRNGPQEISDLDQWLVGTATVRPLFLGPYASFSTTALTDTDRMQSRFLLIWLLSCYRDWFLHLHKLGELEMYLVSTHELGWLIDHFVTKAAQEALLHAWLLELHEFVPHFDLALSDIGADRVTVTEDGYFSMKLGESWYCWNVDGLSREPCDQTHLEA